MHCIVAPFAIRFRDFSFPEVTTDPGSEESRTFLMLRRSRSEALCRFVGNTGVHVRVRQWNKK
jgi:hypothetical protein